MMYGLAAFPPEIVRLHPGLEMHLINDLIKLNDAGVPFTKIADHIEENL